MKQKLQKNNNILIVGASGFIGSSLVNKALENGFSVHAGIRSQTNKEHLDKRTINIIEFDYNDPQKVKEQLLILKQRINKSLYIIYNTGITKAINGNDFEKINFQYLKTLIDALIETDCIPQKFIFMSSLSVMGKGNEKKHTPLSTTTKPKPNSLYGKSKSKAEEYIKNQKEIPYIILRPTGVYGPGEKDYYMMIKSIKAGINLRVGLKPQLLSFVYIDDLVDAVFLSLMSNLRNKTYLISDNKSYYDNEFSQLIKTAINKKHTLNLRVPLFIVKIISTCATIISKFTKKPSTLNSDKYYILKQRNWSCDISPIKSDLGFIPRYNLKRGLDESIKWYIKNNWL